jgi:hypothetical protein
MNNIKEQVVKIKKTRYKLSCIKKYEPFETENSVIQNNKEKDIVKTSTNKFGIYVYFSASNSKVKDYFYFTTAKERDLVLQKLDELFGLNY